MTIDSHEGLLLRIKCEDTPSGSVVNYMGILASIADVTGAKLIVSDKKWRCRTSETKDWSAPLLNIGKNGLGPGLVAGIETDAYWIWAEPPGTVLSECSIRLPG